MLPPGGGARVGAGVLHKDPDALQRAGYLGPAWVGSCRHRGGRCLGASLSCSASTSSMVSMVPWHNYSIVHSLGSLLGPLNLSVQN